MIKIKKKRNRISKYKKIKNFGEEEFRRLTGVKKRSFVEMVKVLEEEEKEKKKKGGAPSELGIEDQLLICLEYLREYRTYFHLGASYGVSETTCYRY